MESGPNMEYSSHSRKSHLIEVDLIILLRLGVATWSFLLLDSVARSERFPRTSIINGRSAGSSDQHRAASAQIREYDVPLGAEAGSMGGRAPAKSTPAIIPPMLG